MQIQFYDLRSSAMSHDRAEPQHEHSNVHDLTTPSRIRLRLVLSKFSLVLFACPSARFEVCTPIIMDADQIFQDSALAVSVLYRALCGLVASWGATFENSFVKTNFYSFFL